MSEREKTSGKAHVLFWLSVTKFAPKGSKVFASVILQFDSCQ